MTSDRFRTIAEHVRIQAALETGTYPRDSKGEIIYVLGQQVSADWARRCSQQILERVTIKEWDEVKSAVEVHKVLDRDLGACQSFHLLGG